MANFVRGAYLVLAACCAALTWAGTASAQAQPVPVTVAPYAITPQSVSGTNLKAMVTYQATASQTSANSRFYTKSIEFSKATLGAAARTRRLLGPSLAITAAVAAAGWAINEITGQITEAPSGGVYTPLPPGVTGWCNAYACGYASADAALKAAAGPDTWKYGAVSGAPGCAPVWNYQGFCIKMNLNWMDYRCPNGVGPCPGPGYVYAWPTGSGAEYEALKARTDPTIPDGLMPPPTPATITDDAIGQMVLNSPGTWKDVLTNPFGSPRVLTPMPAQMQAVQQQYRADTGTALEQGQTEPAPVPSAQENADAASVPDPAGSTEPPPSASASADIEFPEFCDWAAVVCDFVTWFQDDEIEEDTTDVPTTEVDASVEYVSGLGPGTCPAPHSINLLGNSYAMSYEPVCDLAAGGRVFVLISATLMAGLMLVRVFT